MYVEYYNMQWYAGSPHRWRKFVERERVCVPAIDIRSYVGKLELRKNM
jgi:hypothetical protein